MPFTGLNKIVLILDKGMKWKYKTNLNHKNQLLLINLIRFFYKITKCVKLRREYVTITMSFPENPIKNLTVIKLTE